MDKDELTRSVEKMLADLPEPEYHPFVDQGAEVALAMLHVLSRRFGPDFVAEIRDDIRARADRCAESDDVRDQADAPLIREFADHDETWAKVGRPLSSS